MPGGARAVVGSFSARLGLETSDYARGILNAASMNRVFGEGFAAFVSNPLLGSIDIFRRAGRAAIGLASDVLTTAQQMTVLSRELNASTDFVQALKAQYEGLGRSFESSQPALLKVVEVLDQARRSGGQAAEALDALGVNIREAATTDEALRLIIDRLAGIEDQSARTALAVQIFGARAGPELLAVIGANVGAVDAMIDHYRRLGLVMDQETLAATNRLKDGVGNLEQAWQGVRQSLMAGFLSGFAGGDLDGTNRSVTDLAATLNRDLVPAMKDMGELSKDLLEILRDISPLLDVVRYAASSFGGLTAAINGNPHQAMMRWSRSSQVWGGHGRILNALGRTGETVDAALDMLAAPGMR